MKKSINSRLIMILLLCFLLPFLFQTIYVSGHLSRLVEDKILNTTYKSLENSTLLFSNVLQTQFDMVNFYKSDSGIIYAAGAMEEAGTRARRQIQQEVITRLVKDNSIERYRYPFYFILLDYQGNMMTNYTYTPYGGYDEIYDVLSETDWFHTLKESYTDATVMFSGTDLLNERGTDKLYAAANLTVKMWGFCFLQPIKAIYRHSSMIYCPKLPALLPMSPEFVLPAHPPPGWNTGKPFFKRRKN